MVIYARGENLRQVPLYLSNKDQRPTMRVLGLKGDMDDEREPFILTDGRTDRLIRHRDAGMHLKQLK